jgi:hypothetical protein
VNILQKIDNECFQKNAELLDAELKWISVCLFDDMAHKKKNVDLNVLEFVLFPLLGFRKAAE